MSRSRLDELIADAEAGHAHAVQEFWPLSRRGLRGMLCYKCVMERGDS